MMGYLNKFGLVFSCGQFEFRTNSGSRSISKVKLSSTTVGDEDAVNRSIKGKMGSRITNWKELFDERLITEAVCFTENNRPIVIALFTKENMLQWKASSIQLWQFIRGEKGSMASEKDMILGVVVFALFPFQLLQLIFGNQFCLIYS
jgi:hypothetical protein